MNYTEAKKAFYKYATLKIKEMDMKLLEEAGMEPKYTDSTLWFETVEYNTTIEMIATNFKFTMYLTQEFEPSTHVIELRPRLKVNSNSQPDLKEEYFDNLITDVNKAKVLLSTIVENKEYIASVIKDIYTKEL